MKKIMKTVAALMLMVVLCIPSIVKGGLPLYLQVKGVDGKERIERMEIAVDFAYYTFNFDGTKFTVAVFDFLVAIFGDNNEILEVLPVTEEQYSLIKAIAYVDCDFSMNYEDNENYRCIENELSPLDIALLSEHQWWLGNSTMPIEFEEVTYPNILCGYEYEIKVTNEHGFCSINVLVSPDAAMEASEKLEKASSATLISGSYKGHDYVDLGLPSGTLWATCNVGATTPEDYGDYFAWGETEPKEVYESDNYKYNKYSGEKFHIAQYITTKYTNSDGLTVLESDDDAVVVNWGKGWRTPTVEEWDELYKNTTNIWATKNHVNGRLFTASNGNSLFLPACGNISDKARFYGINGSYWTATQSVYNFNLAIYFFFDWEEIIKYSDARRTSGRCVRPVRSAR